jgi:hypothetical protein
MYDCYFSIINVKAQIAPLKRTDLRFFILKKFVYLNRSYLKTANCLLIFTPQVQAPLHTADGSIVCLLHSHLNRPKQYSLLL